MVKGLKNWIFKRNFKCFGTKLKGRKFATVVEILERYAEVAAIAQGGMIEYAQDLARKEIQERRKILLVGGGESISIPLFEYAIGFARRMGYEIILLNCLLPQRNGDISVSNHEYCVKEVENKGEGDTERLLYHAILKGGIKCRYFIGAGSLEKCIRSLLDKIRRVDFVLMECDTVSRMSSKPIAPIFCFSTA